MLKVVNVLSLNSFSGVSQRPPSRDVSRLPGPQVPPRASEGSQERMLSVSGKKKCSHCKEELGTECSVAHARFEGTSHFMQPSVARSRSCDDHREPAPLLPLALLPVLRLPRAVGQRQQWHRRQGAEQQASLPQLLLQRRRCEEL